MAAPKSRARRGVEKHEILGAAFNLFADVGEAGFSIRKLGGVIGVDPMTVLHHFRSKDELLRAIADHAVRSVEVPVATASWQNDLRAVADAYRDLAHRHPRVFHLHFRYNATGPADHVSSEIVYCAMRPRPGSPKPRQRASVWRSTPSCWGLRLPKRRACYGRSAIAMRRS